MFCLVTPSLELTAAVVALRTLTAARRHCFLLDRVNTSDTAMHLWLRGRAGTESA